jgi:flagellar motor switch protein FliM
MVHAMKVTGRTTKLMEWVNSFMQMVMCTRAIGSTIKRMGRELTHTLMELSTMEIGLMTSNMDGAWSLGPMELNMRANTRMERKTAKES